MQDRDIIRIAECVERKVVRKVGLRNVRTLTRRLVGILVMVCAVVMWIHCAVLLAGCDCLLATVTCKCTPLTFFLLILLSVSYEYGVMHRLMCCYVFGVSCCIDHQCYVGFGRWLFEARFLAFGLGSMLMAACIRAKVWKDILWHVHRFG